MLLFVLFQIITINVFSIYVLRFRAGVEVMAGCSLGVRPAFIGSLSGIASRPLAAHFPDFEAKFTDF